MSTALSSLHPAVQALKDDLKLCLVSARSTDQNIEQVLQPHASAASAHVQQLSEAIRANAPEGVRNSKQQETEIARTKAELQKDVAEQLESLQQMAEDINQQLTGMQQQLKASVENLKIEHGLIAKRQHNSQSTFLSLPEPLLHTITRRAGREARPACKPLSTSFGPPAAALRLPTDVAFTLGPFHPNPAASSLFQWPNPDAVKTIVMMEGGKLSGNVLGLICQKFPNLEELRLKQGASEYSQLVPSLKRLQVPMFNDTEVLTHLTGLQQVTAFIQVRAPRDEWVSYLSPLTQLQNVTRLSIHNDFLRLSDMRITTHSQLEAMVDDLWSTITSLPKLAHLHLDYIVEDIREWMQGDHPPMKCLTHLEIRIDYFLIYNNVYDGDDDEDEEVPDRFLSRASTGEEGALGQG